MKHLIFVLVGSFMTYLSQPLVVFDPTYPELQKEAFAILVNKCNDCHKKEKPQAVFTSENMDDYARKINRQVFVFKRMPQGKDIVLTKEEKQTLKSWIKAVKRK